MSDRLSCLIPFAGFYNTWHDAEFDNCLEYMFDPEDSSAEYAGPLRQRFFDTIDWRAAHTAYAKDYARNFASALGCQVCEWEEMVSPREYNFKNDRLFAKFDATELRAMLARVDIRAELNSVAADMFTSRSGFISHYSPDVESWGEDLADWDYNQRSALLQAAANVIIGDGETFNQEKEFDLMESARCNGYIDDYIWENTTDGAVTGNRCYKVSRYLAARETR
jgi:hypothetical protein